MAQWWKTVRQRGPQQINEGHGGIDVRVLAPILQSSIACFVQMGTRTRQKHNLVQVEALPVAQLFLSLQGSMKVAATEAGTRDV